MQNLVFSVEFIFTCRIQIYTQPPDSKKAGPDPENGLPGLPETAGRDSKEGVDRGKSLL
jgi:hypothetical protein